MTQVDSMTPWHAESYDRLLRADLPELIATRLPLDTYQITATSPQSIVVELGLANGNGAGRTRVQLPRPDRNGVFDVDGHNVVVIPVASSEDLETAEVKCVGDQLLALIEPRIPECPADLAWTDDLVASYLPLDRWILGFLNQSEAVPDMPGTVQPVDETNGYARIEHSRRLIIDVARGHQRVVTWGQFGRTCPIMTPEGPNIGRVLSIARGAAIRDGRLVIVDDRPEMKLSLTASAIPLLQHDDTNRLLMGANMMRQWLTPETPEPALVQTGTEPAAPGFWGGRNLLTAFVSWGADTFEDAIVISESCAQRMSFAGDIEPGDKLSNRHGTKGVVGRILPDREMPHLQDGIAVELVFNFIGVHTRMNYGQIREAVLGRIARSEGAPVILPPFTGPTHAELKKRLREAGLPENGMETLRMGSDGDDLQRPSTVGYVYWGKTQHLAVDKLRVYTDTGGNRQGEQECYQLRKMGAFALIAETFGLRAIEGQNALGLAQRVSEGPISLPQTPLPAFTDLQRRLGTAGVRMELDRDRVRFSLEPPAGETLALACSIPHPWLHGCELREVGRLDDLPEFDALAAANDRMQRTIDAGSPDSLAARARENLVRTVNSLFDVLLQPQHLHLRLGNRVAFSARSVIAPGGELNHDQLGLPDEMAWGLFGPVLSRELGDPQQVLDRTPTATAALDLLISELWVVVNRAPSVWPTSLLAFHPVRTPERVVRLPLMACPLMNADFDGDQVAVFLPLTAEGQQEAGEKLSIAAHLSRDPSLLNLLLPTQDHLLGLAYLRLGADGRQQIAEIAGSDLIGSGGHVDRQSVRTAMADLLQQQGVEATLDLLQRLRFLGQDAIMRSGASVCAFAGESLTSIAPPDLDDVEASLAWNDNMDDLVVSRDDYESLEYGPQLLAVRSGARGNPNQLHNGMLGAVIADVDRHLVFVPTGYVEGHEPDDIFMWTVGARRGLAQIHVRCDELGSEQRRASAPEGFNVLARAIRSRCPGAVLARAAAVGEIDPLKDVDSRALVGMLG